MDFNGIGFTIINLIILALNLKMYTEYFKDKKIDKRTSYVPKETSIKRSTPARDAEVPIVKSGKTTVTRKSNDNTKVGKETN